MRFSLLRPWLLFLGLIAIALGACTFVFGGLQTALLPLAAEVHAHQLIAEGAINIERTGEILASEGFAFNPDSGKETGLGRFIVRESDVAVVRSWITLAGGGLVALGLVQMAGAFGRAPTQPRYA